MVATYTCNTKPCKKEMVHDDGNSKNFLLINHHLIKNNQLVGVETIDAREFIPFQFSLKILHPSHKNTFKITSVVCNWCGAIFTYFLELLQLIQNQGIIAQKITIIITQMCCIEIKKNFLSLVKETQNHVLFANLRMKQTFIFMQIVPKLVSFGLTLEIFNGNSKPPSLTLQSTMFGFLDINTDIFLVLSHI